MIIAIYATYYLAIGIAYVTNALKNNLKASSEQEIIGCPPHYLTCFKFHFPTIHIEHAPNVRYVMDIWRGTQGT